MKRLFFLPVLILLFAACSTDTEDMEVFDRNMVMFSTIDPATHRLDAVTKTPSCISSLSGSTFVDVSGGFTNPKVVFVADVPGYGAQTKSYSVHLEMQVLADCEDLASGTGAIIRHSLYNVAIPTLSDPTVSLSQSQLPSSCYRWRFVVEGGTLKTQCVTSTPWYFEPLF